MNLAKLLFEKIPKLPSLRTRDFTGFWATDAGKCSRDLYWRMIGEPITDPMDFKGHVNTSLGSITEEIFKRRWLSKLGPYGVHVIDEQISVGGSNPPWQGYVDMVLAYKEGSEWIKEAVEFKTCWGRGADFVYQNRSPKEDHILQLGLYLKDFEDKQIPITHGSLVYLLISSNPDVTGIVLVFPVQYKNGFAVCDTMYSPNGETKIKPVKLSVTKVLEKFSKVMLAAQNKKCPAPDYVYKYPLTPELLKETKDWALKAAIEGKKVLGDYQPSYSSYKKKILEVDGITPEYTEEEIGLLKAEYRKRHPKSKI